MYLDEKRNVEAIQQEMCISSEESSAQVWVVPTDEGQIVAEETAWCVIGSR
jgi:acetate kinase